MKKALLIHIFSFALLAISVSVFSQATLSGPTCVIPGTEYQYDVVGNVATDSTARICVSGGAITSADSSCTSDLSTGYIRIIWDSTATGSITLNSMSGRVIKKISMAPPIDPGNITDSAQTQMIDYNALPQTIICSAATGGSCNPTFIYQWQQSTNALDWDDIGDNTDQNLLFSSPLMQSIFYRRKTTDKASGTIYYSELAAVYVKAEYK